MDNVLTFIFSFKVLFLFKKYHLSIWLQWVFTVACGIFPCGMQTLSCGMWDPVPQAGIELQSCTFGSSESNSLDHQGSPIISFWITKYFRLKKGFRQ